MIFSPFCRGSELFLQGVNLHFESFDAPGHFLLPADVTSELLRQGPVERRNSITGRTLKRNGDGGGSGLRNVTAHRKGGPAYAVM